MLEVENSLEGNQKLVACTCRLQYVNSHHASCEDRKSIYCYMFMLAGGPITCKSGFSNRCVSGTAESEVRVPARQ